MERRISHDIHLCPGILCMQGLHDRCCHDGITDITERDQQDLADLMCGWFHLLN